MNENIDFIVLEHDDGAGCALIAATVDGAVPAIDGYNTPYIVAEGYDHAARDWEDCRLFDDIGKAKLAYEKLRGRDYSVDADKIGDSAITVRDLEDVGCRDCKDAAEKRDPCLIGAMAQASAAKSATAEGEAGGKKL